MTDQSTQADAREPVDSLGGSGPAASTPPVALGDFRIVREVGRGGMGVVYEAEQLSLRRRVALKVLPFAAVMDPKNLQRFYNEARAAAALDHPHVVKVFGVGQDRGIHYIAMQFVDGRSLADLIRERLGISPAGTVGEEGSGRSKNPVEMHALTTSTTSAVHSRTTVGGSRTPVDPAYARRVAEWGVQAADALEHAHDLGIVHRDVKPGNLLVDGRGALYVADFGLAKLTADPGVTGTGDLLGTPLYMSPEQAAAKHNLVDHRSDVYSLGATLYELITLTPVAVGKDRADILRQIADTDPTPPRQRDRHVPRDLETVVLRCLEKDPARRYPSARELSEDLRRFLQDRPVKARRESRLTKAWRWCRRNRLATIFMVSLVLGLVTTMSLTAWALRERECADMKSNSEREMWVNQMVGRLRSEILLNEDRRWAVTQNTLFTDPERALALEIVNSWREPSNPRLYFEKCWEFVRDTKYGDPTGHHLLEPYARGNPEQYREAIETDRRNDPRFRFALHHAEAACRLEPNNVLYRTVRGIALYRLGRFQDSLDVLAPVDRKGPQGLYSIAFNAMALYRLGNKDEARALVDEVACRVNKLDWADDFDARAFLVEAESVTGLRPRNPWE